MAERRSADRHKAVCRIACVLRAGDTGLWRVRNISDAGMMLAADVPVAIGERLEISLSENVGLAGDVAWAEKGRCGIAFAAEIDALAILRSLAAEQRAEGYRVLCLPVEAEAIITLGDGARAIDLVDISHTGAGFRCDVPVEPGIELGLLLPGGELRRQALVR